MSLDRPSSHITRSGTISMTRLLFLKKNSSISIKSRVLLINSIDTGLKCGTLILRKPGLSLQQARTLTVKNSQTTEPTGNTISIEKNLVASTINH